LDCAGKGNVDANTFCFWYSIEGTAKGGFFRCIGCTNTITSNALQHGRGVRSPCFPYFSYFTSESLSASGLAYTIVPVKKKNGRIRICVDFRDLNKACPKGEPPFSPQGTDSYNGYGFL